MKIPEQNLADKLYEWLITDVIFLPVQIVTIVCTSAALGFNEGWRKGVWKLFWFAFWLALPVAVFA